MSIVPSVGLISGTGEEGRGIALRLGNAGVPLFLGSRSIEKATATSEELNRILRRDIIAPSENTTLIRQCQILFLTVPFTHVEGVLQAGFDLFWAGQIVVDVTVPVAFKGGPHLMTLERPSGSEVIRALLPSHTALVAAFKTLPAELLGDIEAPLDCDDFVCSDDAEPKSRVLEILNRIPGVRWIDLGPLRVASILEHMTLLAILANRRFKVHGSRFRLLGVP